MAQISDVLSFSRAIAQTDSNGLTDANGLIFANEGLSDFRRRLITAGVDASGLQEAYRDGTANVGTYLYPTDKFFLKTIELNYASTDVAGYKTATQIDVSNIAGGDSFSALRENASTSAPLFDDRGDWYEIFPTPTSSNSVSALIRLIYFKKPTDYSATSSTIDYPESIDYRILGLRIASNYMYSKEKYLEGDMLNARYEEKVRDLIATLSRGSQQPIQATEIQLDGWSF